MYHFHERTIESDQAIKYLLFENEERLTYGNFISLLKSSEPFRDFFIDLLSHIPFGAYHWETPPVTDESMDRSFEFVASRSPGIDLPPDPGPFRSYFREQPDDREIAIFDSLGGDARLIAPAPLGEGRKYSHIGVFTEVAPKHQQQALWKAVGEEMDRQLSEKPIWLNTAGGGVAWLHVRLDSRPKYYLHRSYKR